MEEGISMSEVVVSPKEQKLTSEQVAELPRQVHDAGIAYMSKNYQIGPNKEAYFFHDYHKEDGTDGHTANVVGATRLYIQAVESQMGDLKQLDRDNFPPNEEIDPLRLYASIDQYLTDTKRGLFLGRKWDKLLSKRQKELVDLSFEYAAKIHDLGNAVESVDWRKIKKAGSFEEAMRKSEEEGPIEFLDRMRFKAGELAAATMYWNFIETYAEELGLKNDDEKELTRVIGYELIRRTTFHPHFCDQNEQSRVLINLAVFDQVGQALWVNSLPNIIGLVNENRIRSQTESMDSPSFERDVSFKKFVPWRFGELEKIEGGISMDRFFDYLDKFRRAHPEEFSQLIGIDVSNLESLPNLKGFVRKRLEIQQHVATMLWPGGSMKRGDEVVKNVSFEEAFAGWTAADFAFMRKASSLFRERYWDPQLSTEDFQKGDVRAEEKYKPRKLRFKKAVAS